MTNHNRSSGSHGGQAAPRQAQTEVMRTETQASEPAPGDVSASGAGGGGTQAEGEKADEKAKPNAPDVAPPAKSQEPPAPAEALSSQEPPESEIERKKAELLRQEQFRAAESARRASVLEQSKRAGEVDYKAAQAEGEKAASRVRDRSLMGRRPGVYVLSPVKLANERAEGIECPIGMRITDAMTRKLPAAELQRLCEQGVLEDLR